MNWAQWFRQIAKALRPTGHAIQRLALSLERFNQAMSNASSR